ncbi:hypothetical protein Y5W_02402 [Alcanivorax sp. 521-1]|uniref:DUF1365 domain-containing protein n=1 Tax=Alloalcanivorax profundimaris TaxID=2735259 RepID=A0ABS0ASJ6_9GAMM|nr:DUF1365 domain-containing protein [Alloalcanivorax profundimaris]MBF5057108.1 hypothetical protein [Alloalcanivorax profundimaris]
MIPDFALARGHVWHRRYTPMDHRFRVPLWLVWSDVDAPDRLLAGHWLWGRRWRPVTFRDRDFVDASGRPLGDKVRERAGALGLDWSAGRVHMLGQWRTFGVLFNPLVLYFHFPAGAQRPDSALAEVRNTPWRERHFYPLRLREEGDEQVVEHDKTFHVSPFLPLALRYHWTLHALFPELRLTLRDQDGADTVFAAGLKLAMVEPRAAAMGAVIGRFGAQGVRTLAGIYWQAWKLWRKGARFHSHPRRSKQDDGEKTHDGR